MNYGFVRPGGARPFDFAARQAFVDIAATEAAEVVAKYRSLLTPGDSARHTQDIRTRCTQQLRKSGASQEELVFLDLLWQDTFTERLESRAKP